MSTSILSGSSTGTTVEPSTNSTALGQYYQGQITSAANDSFWSLNSLFNINNKWFWVMMLGLGIVLAIWYFKKK